MKDLRGNKVRVPGFRYSIKDAFREAMAAIGIGDGKIVRGGFKRCIFLLLDGFGHRTMSELGVLERMRMPTVEMGSTVPSVTSTALSSIFTGLDPAEHGVIGTEFWLPEAGGGFRVLDFTTTEGSQVVMDPGDLLLGPGLIEQLKADGIGVHAVLPEHHETGLSRALYRGSTAYFAPGIAGMYYGLDKFMRSRNGDIAVAYWEQPDKAAHYGMGPGATRAGLDAVFSMLKRFRSRKAAADTCLIIAGDHGALETSYMTDLLELEHLMNSRPLGGSRHRHLFPRRGKRDGLISALDDTHVLDGPAALKAGFFGRAHEGAYDRIGDIFLLPAKDNALVYDSLPYEADHGGLSPEEMSAAFAHCPLDGFSPLRL